MKMATLRRIARFGISGLLVTGLHVAVAVAFIRLILPDPPLANGVAFTVATLFSYLINTLWSFSSRLHGRTLARFAVVSLIGCGLSVGLSWLAEFRALSYWIG
ncbi:MAG: GtrA family protein, partial [Methylococcaceae bacterium]|nr:GtrA family protein [Methylococcaceae bacterium]